MLNLFNKRQRVVFGVLGTLIFFLLIIFLGGKIFGSLGKSGRFLGVVVWKAKSAVEVDAEYARLSIKSKKSLIDEILSLRDSMEDKKIQDVVISSLQKETDDLKKVLNHPTGSDYVLASILSRPPQSLYDTFVIDVGVKDGINIDDNVLVEGVFIIGTIERVDNKTSLVKLFSSPGTAHDAYLPDIGVSITVTGSGNGSFIAEAPRDFPVEIGMGVVRAGTNSKALGVVTNVDADPRDPTKRILIEGPMNIQHVRYVGVEINKEAEEI